MNKPHKHAEVIKAWADGKEVEYRYPNGPNKNWNHIGSKPMWFLDFEYRIKPELKDPGIVFRDAFYRAIYPDQTPISYAAEEWSAAAKAVIEAYKAGELKVD